MTPAITIPAGHTNVLILIPPRASVIAIPEAAMNIIMGPREIRNGRQISADELEEIRNRNNGTTTTTE
jgi:hypothetical protein